MEIKTLSKICLLFFLYFVVSYFYIGITTIPREGDSLGYHIPLAKSFLDGRILDPHNIVAAPFLKYSPASSEGILSLFYLLHIPPNLYNVLGVILFFFSLLYLAKKFGLNREISAVFATGIATLTGIVRWMDTQIIDIYLALFFVMGLALLQKPERKISYFLKLGFFIGMLIGSKYTGLLFAFVLLLIYAKKILKFISLKNVTFFAVPVLLFGGAWYLRNYFVTGNPLYPQGFLFFKDAGYDILEFQVGSVVVSSLYGFFGTVNALISEYMVWVLSVPIVLFFIARTFLKKDLKLPRGLVALTIVGVLNLIIYTFLPSDNKDHIMVSVLRYSYPAFIPFILGLFLLAEKFKKAIPISIVALGNMMWVGFPVVYNPKLIFIYLPIALYFYFKK